MDDYSQATQQENLWIQIALIIILALSGFLFFLGYDYGLPIIGHDEGTFYREMLGQQGIYTEPALPGYPPMIIGLTHLSYNIVKRFNDADPIRLASETIAIIRLSHVVVNTITVGLIFLVGRQLKQPLVGLIAGLAWAMMPAIFEHTRLAIAEAWLILFVVLSFYTFLKTLETKKAHWAILCTLAGIMSVATKYNAFPILGFGVWASLILAWDEDKSWLRVFLFQVGLIIVAALVILFGFRAVDLLASDRPEIVQFAETDNMRLLDLKFITSLFKISMESIGLNSILFLALLSVGSFAYVKNSIFKYRMAWLGIFIVCLSYIGFVAAFVKFSTTQVRYLAPISTIFIILALTSLAYILQSFFPNRKRLQYALLILASALWLYLIIGERVEQIQTLTRTDTRVGLSRWSEQSLPSGTIALAGNNWFIFDPIWGGYHGALRPWVDWEEWQKRPLDDWLNNHIHYVQYSGNYPGNHPDFLFDREDILYLKSFPILEQENNWSGSTFHIYRLWPIETEVSIHFGEGIILKGYDLSADTLKAGDVLSWTPYWTVKQKPESAYQLFLHFVPIDSFDVLAQADGTPALATRPTTTWDDSYETIIGSTFTLHLPETLESGDYRLIAGLYDLETFARLTTSEALDYFVIDTVSIQP